MAKRATSISGMLGTPLRIVASMKSPVAAVIVQLALVGVNDAVLPVVLPRVSPEPVQLTSIPVVDPEPL